MIDEENLEKFKNFFKDERQLEKDYLIDLMLKVISVNKLSNVLEFKGGTALYIFHGLNRFSEDLDFSYIGEDKEINKHIDNLIEPIIKDFNLSYRITKDKGNIVVRDEEGNLSAIRSEFFIEGPLFNRTHIRHKIKIDISLRNDTIMKPEYATIVSKYNDISTIILYKMPIEEMLTEKLYAIIERNKARDLYDAYFILKNNNVKFDEKLTEEKFKKRGKAFKKEELLERIAKFKESLWKEELSYLIQNLPEIDEIKSFLRESIK